MTTIITTQTISTVTSGSKPSNMNSTPRYLPGSSFQRHACDRLNHKSRKQTHRRVSIPSNPPQGQEQEYPSDFSYSVELRSLIDGFRHFPMLKTFPRSTSLTMYEADIIGLDLRSMFWNVAYSFVLRGMYICVRVCCRSSMIRWLVGLWGQDLLLTARDWLCAFLGKYLFYWK